MYLLNVETLQLEEFLTAPPPYAILSHTWISSHDEVLFRDIRTGNLGTLGKDAGLRKVRGCCEQATRDGLAYVWIDSCCIDKADLTELSEAIYSMFRWYQNAVVCYAYLVDLPPVGDAITVEDQDDFFKKSRWFTRGWTLQELLAPSHLCFFDESWTPFATKTEMADTIEEITGIPQRYLFNSLSLNTASVAQRMSWAAKRSTTRPEDRAYSLLGLFGVTMQLIYGMGGRGAFVLLQRTILEQFRDSSVFAWGLSRQTSSATASNPLLQTTDAQRTHGIASDGIWASSPSDYEHCGNIVVRQGVPLNISHPTGGLLSMELSLSNVLHANPLYGLLDCGPKEDPKALVGVPLKKKAGSVPEAYIRPRLCSPMIIPVLSLPLRLPSHKIQVLTEPSADEDAPLNENWLTLKYEEGSLFLVDTHPSTHWEGNKAKVPLASNTTSAILYAARLRCPGEEERDLLVFIELVPEDTQFRLHCHLMTHALLQPWDLALHSFGLMRPAALGLQRACIGAHTLVARIATPVHGNAFNITINRSLAVRRVAAISADMEVDHTQRKVTLFRLLMDEPTWPESVASRPREAAEDGRVANHMRLIGLLEERERYLWFTNLGTREELLRRIDKLEPETGPGNWLETHIMKSQSDPNSSSEPLIPIFWAIEHGFQSMARLLVEKSPAVLDTVDSNGLTPLQAAAGRGMLWLVRIFLRKGGANVNATNGLAMATGFGHEAVVRLLLEAGADVRAKDNEGWVPLAVASRFGHVAIARLLIEAGADVGSPHNMPLSLACEFGYEANVQLLVENGADVNTVDSTGLLPLTVAAQEGQTAVVQLLIKSGVDVNKEDATGHLPLTVAAQAGHTEIVQRLIEGGAEVDKEDATGRLPLTVATQAGHTEIVQRLIEGGALVDKEDATGHLPLTVAAVAAQAGHTETVQRLIRAAWCRRASGRSARHDAVANCGRPGQ